MNDKKIVDLENSNVVVSETSNLPSTEYRDAIPDSIEEEINIRDYLDILVRRKWVIAGILLLVFVSTFIYSMTATPLYMATATLEITPEDNKITKFEEVMASELKSREYYETQISLLKSTTLMENVIEKLNLMENPVIQEELFGDPNAKKGLLATIKKEIKILIKGVIKGEDSELKNSLITDDYRKNNALLKYMQGNMEAQTSRDSMLVTISFSSSSRALSQQVINSVAEEFLAWKMEKKMEASQLAQDFLMKQIESTKIKLEKAEENLNYFAKSAGIVSLETSMNSVYRQLEELNTALAVAEADLVLKQSVFEQAKKEGLSNLPQVLDSKVIDLLKEKQAELQSQYDDLAVTFKDGYPMVRQLNSRIDALDKKIAIEENSIFKSIETQYRGGVETVERLRERVMSQEARTIDLNERTTQYKILDREVNTNKQIYDSLLQRSKEIESMVGVSPSNIGIVDRASLPILPYKPNVKRNLLLAIVIGCFLGVGLAFLLENLDDTITNPDQISDRFHIPILGVIPLADGKNDYPVEKTFVSDPRASVSEALRTTRISLQLSGGDSHSKSFVITSSSQGEGKTTIATNLTAAYASAGQRTLLIDCDLRRPRVHKIFQNGNNGHDNSRGLSSFLAGVADKPVILQTGIDNLHYMPAGPIPPNPVELLASRRFSEMIKSLQKQFDQIVLDAPPHNGLADVLVIVRQVGGVVLVSSIGETTRDSLRIFKNSMKNVQGKILGSIVNKVDLSHRYGYGTYYKYYYAYHYEYGQDKKRGKGRKKIAA